MKAMTRAGWLSLMLTLTASTLLAQDYPTRPIRMVAPFTAGSGSDILARLIAPKLRDAWGQQVVVGWYGMLAPGRTPRPIVEKVSKEMAHILDLPDIKERIVGIGGLAKWTSPQAFERMIRSEIETRTKVFKAAGSKAE